MDFGVYGALFCTPITIPVALIVDTTITQQPDELLLIQLRNLFGGISTSDG